MRLPKRRLEMLFREKQRLRLLKRQRKSRIKMTTNFADAANEEEKLFGLVFISKKFLLMPTRGIED